jgi:hypothetical protein
MRFVATLLVLIAFALVRPLAGQAEGLGPCMEPVAATATAMDMPCHEMTGPVHNAPEKPAPAKTVHASCASACCASPALVPAASAGPVMLRQPVLLVAAASPTASPVPHAPDLRPPIA